MNSSALMSYAPIFIADEEGFFAEEGITMEYTTFNRTSEALPLVVSGDLDVYAGVLNAGLLNVLGQEPNFKVVADRGSISSEDPCLISAVVFRKSLYESGELRGPADLKGRIIVANTSGTVEYALTLYLAQVGLTLDDIIISDIPQAGWQDALANGTVDAIFTTEPRLFKVLQGGNAVLDENYKELRPYLQSSVLVFGKNLLIDHREIGIRFLKAYMRGVEQYQAGKTDHNVEILAKYTGEDTEVLQGACWPAIRTDGQINFDEGVDPYQQWAVMHGDLDAPITEEQFWDPSLLQEALSNP